MVVIHSSTRSTLYYHVKNNLLKKQHKKQQHIPPKKSFGKISVAVSPAEEPPVCSGCVSHRLAWAGQPGSSIRGCTHTHTHTHSHTLCCRLSTSMSFCSHCCLPLPSLVLICHNPAASSICWGPELSPRTPGGQAPFPTTRQGLITWTRLPTEEPRWLSSAFMFCCISQVTWNVIGIKLRESRGLIVSALSWQTKPNQTELKVWRIGKSSSLECEWV